MNSVDKNAYNRECDRVNQISRFATTDAESAALAGEDEVPDVGAKLRASFAFTEEEALEALRSQSVIAKLGIFSTALLDATKAIATKKGHESVTAQLQGSLPPVAAGLQTSTGITIPVPIIAAFAQGTHPPPLLALTATSLRGFNRSGNIPTRDLVSRATRNSMCIFDSEAFLDARGVSANDADAFDGIASILYALNTLVTICDHITNPASSPALVLLVLSGAHEDWLERMQDLYRDDFQRLPQRRRVEGGAPRAAGTRAASPFRSLGSAAALLRASTYAADLHAAVPSTVLSRESCIRASRCPQLYIQSTITLPPRTAPRGCPPLLMRRPRFHQVAGSRCSVWAVRLFASASDVRGPVSRQHRAGLAVAFSEARNALPAMGPLPTFLPHAPDDARHNPPLGLCLSSTPSLFSLPPFSLDHDRVSERVGAP
uniref:Uncharacterized protein n=1 Tax=Mycena chlorophos TaxID=658473 RepID=A0ABQ0LFS3_MYCCL|nr:predicted protein [Mycena chlorophos]